MSNPSLRKSNLSNERSVSQSALPVYSSTMQSKTQASNTLNASAEISASENNSVKFITTKLSHSLKFQGRSASLAQINVSNENSTIMSTSNDQLDKTIRNQNVPYIKPLLLKDLAKSKD
ncbi:unnamed protein product [Heterobilharzia americana]|nr:unnamed protein product [Heterobilharzia americana]